MDGVASTAGEPRDSILRSHAQLPSMLLTCREPTETHSRLRHAVPTCRQITNPGVSAAGRRSPPLWHPAVSVEDRSAGTGVRPRHGADPKVAEADPVTSLGRCREPLVSGERKAAGSVLALPAGYNLVDGEFSVLESEPAGCKVEQPRVCAGWGDESLSVLP